MNPLKILQPFELIQLVKSKIAIHPTCLSRQVVNLQACLAMSQQGIGALIVLEQEVGLKNYSDR